MDPIPMTVAAAVAGALIAAISVMYKSLTSSAKDKDKECKARVAALESKVADIYAMLVKKSETEVNKTEQREQKAWDRAMEVSRVLERIGEVTRHAIRILRRHETETDLTPPPRAQEEHRPHSLKTPSYEKPLSDETSRFVKDGQQQ